MFVTIYTYTIPPTFEVTAFASVAPVRALGTVDEASSDKLNCEIANRRAHAVGAFLAHDNSEEYAHLWRCPDIGEDYSSAKQLCAGSEDKSYAGIVGRRPINVRVVQWVDHKDMDDSKPADDGRFPDERRFPVEILNRAVHIRVPENFCRGG